MSDSGVNNNVKADATVNINHPNFNLSVHSSSLNILAAAGSVASGGALALKVAQQVPGGPGVKVALGGATWLASQALTVGVSKILNYNNSSNNRNNLIGPSLNFTDCKNILKSYNKDYLQENMFLSVLIV